MIKTQVIGNIGKDCIVKEINGKNVINFSVAHTERYKDKEGVQKEHCIWVDCSYWTDRTALAPYLVKGVMVYVEGQPAAEAYLNKDGLPVANLRLRVSNLQLLGGKREAGDNRSYLTNNAAPAPAAATAQPDAADDLPF